MSRKELACEERERSISGSEKSTCRSPENICAGTEALRSWSTVWDQEGERHVVGEAGRSSDHAGLGKSVGLYSVVRCIYICENTFVILIFPHDVTNTLFFTSLRRL